MSKDSETGPHALIEHMVAIPHNYRQRAKLYAEWYASSAIAAESERLSAELEALRKDAERLAAREAEIAALRREAHTWRKAAETYAADAERLTAKLERALTVCRCAVRAVDSGAYQGVSDEDCDLERAVNNWRQHPAQQHLGEDDER